MLAAIPGTSPASPRPRRARVWGAGLLALASLALPVGCAGALTLDQVSRIVASQVLQPSASRDSLDGYLRPTPIASGTIAPGFDDGPTIDVANLSGHAQWFAFVDSLPAAFFEHPVLYVFVDDVTGAVITFPAQDWPSLNGVPLGTDTSAGARLLKFVPLVPHPAPGGSSASSAPSGDWGDAPDGTPAYFGAVTGHFHTQWTGVASGSAHTLVTGNEMLGRTVSRESGPSDPADPDGVPNLVDGDSDEREFLLWNPNPTPPTVQLVYDVTVNGPPAGADRYVNVLIDFDRDGAWSGAAAGQEWCVVNQAVNVPAGTTATQLSPAFAWTSGDTALALRWMRVMVTPDSLPRSNYGAAGWDGSGAFAAGEIEDFGPPPVMLPSLPALAANAGATARPSAGTAKFGRLSPARPSPAERKPIPPVGPFNWGLTPRTWAFVLQGADKPDQDHVAKTAAFARRMLAEEGYHFENETADPVPASTLTDLLSALSSISDQVSCVDHVLIYVVSHGKNTSGGVITLGDGDMTGAQLQHWLDQIPACPGQTCTQRNVCCDVTVVLESCHAKHFLDGPGGTSPLARKGRRVVAACGSAELAQAPDEIGAFTRGWDQATRDPANDSNQDGAMTPTEIEAAVAKSIRGQTPTVRDSTCPCVCAMQINPNWQALAGGGGIDQSGNDVTPGANAHYYIVGSTSDTSSEHIDDVIAKGFDPIGMLEWSADYGRGAAYVVRATPDSGFALAGTRPGAGGGDASDALLLRGNAAGDSLWSRSYGGPWAQAAYGMDRTTDGGFILAGTSNARTSGSFTDAWLVRTNVAGDTLWTRTYGGGANRTLASVQQTVDGGYVAGGYADAGAVLNPMLMRFDPAGGLIWLRIFTSLSNALGFEARQTSDGGFVLCGQQGGPWIVRTDPSGNPIWSRTFGSSGFASSIRQTSDGGFIVVGDSTTSDRGSQLELLKVSASGLYQWSSIYGQTGAEDGFAVRVAPDGGYVATGRSNSYGAGEYDVLALKTDTRGAEVPPGGAPDLELARPLPNPTAGRVSIAFRLGRGGATDLAVFDVSGRRVATLASGELTPGDHDVLWDPGAAHARNGVYFLRLRSAEGTRERRIVVLR